VREQLALQAAARLVADLAPLVSHGWVSRSDPVRRGGPRLVRAGLPLLWLVQSATGSLLAAVVVARVISGAANFMANRLVVFRASDLPWQRAARRYAMLAGAILVANYALLSLMTDWGLSTLLAKAITELTLFCLSYVIQG
jgi:putative flippase GtrA